MAIIIYDGWLGTVENHSKKWQKTQQTIAKITAKTGIRLQARRLLYNV